MMPEHQAYVEPFAGAAWVLFKKEPSKSEVINDLDSSLVAFFRVLKCHFEEFMKEFRFLLIAREEWQVFLNQMENGGLTDIQRAARFYYVQRLCFGGRVRSRSFGVNPERPPMLNLLRMKEDLSAVHLRLARVLIEHLSYEEVIRRYDRPDTFFYIDPPYFKLPHYNYNLVNGDFEKLAGLLEAVSGKFLMSINDVPEMRKTFSKFEQKSVDLLYCIPKGTHPRGKELLIKNY